MYRKEIVYDRESRDYAMYLDGELVGFARTYHEGEVTLDQLVFDLLSGGAVPDDQPADDFSDVGPEARAVNLNDADADPAYSDGCGLIVAQAATVAALVLAALLG